MSARYSKNLDVGVGAVLSVDFKTVRGKVVGYSILLLLKTAESKEAIRVFDSAHGINEMHRYSDGGGKRNGTEFHNGTLDEGMRAAIHAIERGYLEMIEGWREG
ncbi:MAG TPA: hypothetical protein VFJ64_04030 [Solirubrobacterales bacterium]|nr:hypothetical protein [Solirubrobacterales bacterium]